MSNFWGMNLDLEDFDLLLSSDDLVEEPVDIPTFVRDKKYLGLEFDLSEKQLEIAKHMTQIFKPETLIQLHGEEKGLQIYQDYTKNELVLMIGKGGGKDFTSRVSFAYVAYLLHCLRDPLKYYNKAFGVTIDLLNVAVNAQQAKNVFFDPLKKMLMNSPYFNEQAMFEPRQSEIFFFDRPIRFFSGHSEAEGWEGYELLLVVLDEIAAFKLIPNSTPVLTPNGWVKNGDLKVGDQVIGQNGKPTTVEGVFPNRREAFEITFEDGAKTICSEDHLWTVREYSDGRRPSIKTITIRDFKSLTLKGKYNQKRYAIPVVEPVEFAPSAPLPIDPYVLGVLIGDGSICGDSIKLTSDDSFILDEVQKRLPSEAKIVKASKNSRRFDFRINGAKEIKDGLKELELWNHKSNSKFIPKPYLYASIEDRKLLLAGLMDTDGTPARGNGSYTTVSAQLKDDVIELCRGLGGIPTATKHESWAVVDGEKIPGQDKWMICPRVPFNPFLLPRKAEKWRPHKRALWRSIMDVKSLGYEEDMTCIKVSNEDGLYVIDDYVVTHNTDAELKGANSARAKGSASGIYNMSKVSVISRFPQVGKVVLLSFPRFSGDFITERYKAATHGEEESTWALKAPTWEVNPTITREMLEPEFRRNYIEAEARFGCNPPEMEEGFFREPDLVRRAFSHHDNPLNEDGTFKSWFNGNDGIPRFIHVDLGLKRDKTGLAMVHCAGLKEIETGVGTEKLPIVNVDFLYSWRAEVGSEISFSSVRDMIRTLTRKFPVAMVTFDQWGSQDIMQTLRSWGVRTELHTVKKTDYDTIQTAIYDQRLRGYWHEDLVENELLKLRLINNTKVDHMTTSEKDLADAVAGATFMCIGGISMNQDIEIEFWTDDDFEDSTTKALENFTVPIEESTPIMPAELREWLDMEII